MSLEAWGDEGNVSNEASFEAGKDAMSEDVIDWIDEELEVLNSDLETVKGMIEKNETSELNEAVTRLVQGINALRKIKKNLGET